MSEIEKLREWHKAQVGTTEFPPGSNNVRYNTDYYGKAVSGAYPWCVAYQWDAFRECGLSDLFYDGKKANSCRTLREWAQKNDQWVTRDYQPGDLAQFNFSGDGGSPTHIGWIDRVSGSMVWTYEGNTSKTSDDNGGAVLYRTRQIRYIVGAVRPKYREGGMARYYRQDEMDIVEAPAENVKIVMLDARKNAIQARNFANAGFFANYKEAGQTFTLPVAHLKALCDTENPLVIHYANERGNVADGVVCFDSHSYKAGNEQFYRKALSTLIIRNGRATIEDAVALPADADYAISGVPVMRNGKDISWYNYAKPQGWGSDTVRATKHTFVGIKLTPSAKVYIIGWQTTKPNMILYAEAFKRFRDMGFWDVIKLDGGGSYIFAVNGKVKSSIAENRRINSIITWGETETPGNPYPVPTRTLRKGSKGDDVRWLQYELSKRGYAVGEIDGDFGGKTNAAVRLYQKTAGLVVDGLVGTKTIASLK